MTDYRQPSEIAQRRQICERIKELKANCERLSKTRDELSGRLSKLNKVVDRLIDEKKVQKYDPHLEIDSTSYYISSESSNFHKNKQLPTSKTAATDLITTNDASSHSNSNICPKACSDTFKIKFSQCLSEIVPKAEEIVERCDELCQSRF